MRYDLRNAQMKHACNLGGLLAAQIAHMAGVKAYIADPPVVDEMDDAARITGMPMCPRKPIFHALNQKATARLHCDRAGLVYEQANLIVAHMGGGISVAAHRQGRIVDVNNALDGDGPFAPRPRGKHSLERAHQGLLLGAVHPRGACSSSSPARGGLVAYLGTNSVMEVMGRIAEGDQRAQKVLDAMCYNIAKQIGAMAAALSGRVDGILLTGGIAYNEPVTDYLRDRCGFIAPVTVYPGENESGGIGGQRSRRPAGLRRAEGLRIAAESPSGDGSDTFIGTKAGCPQRAACFFNRETTCRKASSRKSSETSR